MAVPRKRLLCAHFLSKQPSFVKTGSGQARIGILADNTTHFWISAGPSNESNYGELWYCEAAAITGPWRDCVRVISHAGTGTSCYNPLQLQFMDEAGGQAVYVACTFTSMWSSQQNKARNDHLTEVFSFVSCFVHYNISIKHSLDRHGKPTGLPTTIDRQRRVCLCCFLSLTRRTVTVGSAE